MIKSVNHVGSLSKYNLGCRCEACRSCRAEYTRKRRATGKDKVAQANYQRQYRRTPEGHLITRRLGLKRQYGLTLEEYDKLFEEQKGVCAACQEPETLKYQNGSSYLSVDHDHKTGKVRGLLCGRCNKALGMLSDSAEKIKGLANYRLRYKKYARKIR